MQLTGMNRRTSVMAVFLLITWLLLIAHRLLEKPFLLGYTGYQDMYGGVRIPSSTCPLGCSPA